MTSATSHCAFRVLTSDLFQQLFDDNDWFDFGIFISS